MAQEAEREGICPVTEERSLFWGSEEVWRKHHKSSADCQLPKNAWPEPCHR